MGSNLHPTNILNDLNIIQRRLLELQQLGRLHQVLELQGALGHVVRLAPLLYPGDVVVDLEAALPREEVAAHEEVVEGRHADEAEEIFGHLDRDGNGDVSLDEMTMLLVTAGQERRNRAASMQDISQAIAVLDRLLSVFVLLGE